MTQLHFGPTSQVSHATDSTAHREAFGHKHSTAEADKHPALPYFRRLVEFALLADDVLRVHMALPTGHPGLAQQK